MSDTTPVALLRGTPVEYAAVTYLGDGVLLHVATDGQFWISLDGTPSVAIALDDGPLLNLLRVACKQYPSLKEKL